jgi:hypothetical protein
MAQWERETPWRQGQLLTTDAIDAFRLGGAVTSQDVAALVISHDCDIAQGTDAEPVVELIVGRYIETAKGSFTNCKNLRRLHLDCTGGSTPRTIELQVGDRTKVPKSAITGPSLGEYSPRRDITLTYRQRRILQRWLAARYERASFPDEFDRRLKDETGVAERISAALNDSGNDIVAIFFDVDSGEEIARVGKEEPYELAITLVYSTAADPSKAEQSAKDAATRIKDVFTRRCRSKNEKNDGDWHWIELTDIAVISDEALTYAQSQYLVRWYADHISLRADPIQPMLEN